MRRKLAELELEVDRSQGWVRGGTKQEARAWLPALPLTSTGLCPCCSLCLPVRARTGRACLECCEVPKVCLECGREAADPCSAARTSRELQPAQAL